MEKSVIVVNNDVIKELLSYLKDNTASIVLNIDFNGINIKGLHPSKVSISDIFLNPSLFSECTLNQMILEYDTRLLYKIINTYENTEQLTIEITPQSTTFNFVTPKYARTYEINNLQIDNERVTSLEKVVNNLRSINYDNFLRLDTKSFKNVIKSINNIVNSVRITDNSIISVKDKEDMVKDFQYVLFDTKNYSVTSHIYRLELINELTKFSTMDDVIFHFVDSTKTSPTPLKSSIIYSSNVNVNIYLAPSLN